MRPAPGVNAATRRPGRAAGGRPRGRSGRRSLRGSADGTRSRRAGAPGWGAAPPIGASRSRGAACHARHRAQQRARVRMGGRGEDRRTGANSTTLPRYMTATSSAFARSAHVMRDQHQRHAFVALQARSSARICAWVVTSSAVVGSSAIRMLGLGRPARWAMRTRWRRPAAQLIGIGVDPRLGHAGCRLRRCGSMARWRAASLAEAAMGRAPPP